MNSNLVVFLTVCSQSQFRIFKEIQTAQENEFNFFNEVSNDMYIMKCYSCLFCFSVHALKAYSIWFACQSVMCVCIFVTLILVEH